MSYQVSYSGRSKPGSDKIRYYQSSAYGGEKAAPHGYIVTGAYSQGTYATPSTGYYSSTASVPRAARKYEVGRESRHVPSETNKTCLVVFIVVGVAILVAAAIALGVVFGVVNKAGDKNPETATTTPRPDTAVSYDVALTSDREYIPAYDDPTSAEYKALENEILPQVNDAIAESELADSFIDAKLLGVEPGSIIYLLRSYHSSRTVKINAQNQKTYDFETLSEASVNGALQSLYNHDSRMTLTYFMASSAEVTYPRSQTVSLTATLVKTSLIAQLGAPKRASFVQAQKLQLQATDVIVAANNGRKDLGESCVSDTECSDIGAECTGSKCTCTSNYYKKGGRCLHKISYTGTGCSNRLDCATGNAICSSGKCTCDSARFYKSSRDACILKIGLNQTGCTKASDCADPSTVCSAGTCVCTSDKYAMNGACVDKIALYDKGCGSDSSRCRTSGAECRSNYCRCPTRMFYNGAQCVNKFTFNTAGCTAQPGIQCATPGAVCVITSGTTGVCKCPTGTHVYRDGQCYRDKDCSTWYYENQIWTHCLGAAMKIADPATAEADKCGHYEQYMGCVMYQAIVQDVKCTMAVIDGFSPDNSICQGHDYAYLENLMPSTKAGICSNGPSARYMIIYGGLTYDPEYFTSADDRCRTLLTLQGHVFNTFHRDAGCNMADVVELLNHNDVRSDLLDAIPTDCDTVLQVSKCERLGLQSALVNQHCLYAPTQMTFATILSDPSSFNSANGQRKLKCVVYEESLKCLISSAGGVLDECSATDLAPVVKASVRMYRNIMARILPQEAQSLYRIIDFTDCDAALAGVVPSNQCPSSETVANLVVASCMAQVFEATKYTNEAACSRLPAFEACVNNFHPSNAQKCREGHVWLSVHEYLYFVKSTIDGFNPFECREQQEKKCSQHFAESARREQCKKPYDKMVDPNTPEGDKCRHFEAYLGCIIFHALLEGENCTYKTIRDHAWAVGEPFTNVDICHACDYPWMVRDNTGKWQGVIVVRVVPSTQDASITGIVYDLAATGLEYAGIGFSQNGLMTGSDIYTVQPMDVAGENWTVIDRYATSQSKPTPDTSQDISGIHLHYHNNKVGIALFSRKMDTGDGKDYRLGNDAYLLFARGPMTTSTSVPDISKHSFKAVSEQKISFSSCDPFQYLELGKTASLEASCNDIKLHRHLWEYECLPYDFSGLTDQMDLCRMEITRRQCVYNIFVESKLPCTLNDVVSMSQLPIVRAGLLDYVDIGCESKLPDTECEKSYMFEAAEKANMCFSPFYSLNAFVFFDKVNNVNNYMSADGQKKLKCSVFEEHLKCYLSKVPTTSTGATCKPAQIASAAAQAAHMAFSLQFQGQGIAELSFDSCVANIATTMPNVPTPACPSKASIADMVAAQCGPGVLTALGTNPDPDQLCERGSEAWRHCVEFIYIPNRELCAQGHFESALEEHSGKIAGFMAGFNFRNCEAGPECGTWYYTNKIWEKCWAVVTKIAEAPEHEKCEHYAYYMGCVKYASLVSGVRCTIREIDGFSPENSICPGQTYEYLESLMPTTKEGLCVYPAPTDYMTRYTCLNYDPQVLNNDNDRCRALLVVEGCVYSSLHADAGCSMTQVQALMKHSDVTPNLKGFPTDCDTRLQVSNCERIGLQAANVNQQCFAPLAKFMYATMTSDVDSFMNHNGQKKLKCSLYEESIRCLMGAGRGLDIGMEQCSATSLAGVAKASLRLYHSVAKGFLPAEARPYFHNINLDECDAGLSTVVVSDQCPSSGMAADIVTASCMSTIFEATRFTNQSKCLRLSAFYECVKGIGFMNAAKCQEDHANSSIAVYISYLRDTLDGFDPLYCEAESKKKCSVIFAEKAKKDECKKPYDKLVSPETAVDLRCRHFETYLNCLKFYTLLYKETCTFEKLRDLVVSTNPKMWAYDICYACDYPWAIRNDNTGKWSGWVNVHLQTRTQTAVISAVVYDLATTGLEYVGIGISQDNLMSDSDIYTVAPVDAAGENWVVTDRYASARAKPLADTLQAGKNDVTWSQLWYTENKVGLAMFTRKISTGDSKDVDLVGSKYLFFARGPMTSNGFTADLSKHNFKQMKQETFSCVPWTYMESTLSTLTDACRNPSMHRHFWEYECIMFDFSIVPDQADRCRSELSLRQCVYNIFNEAQLPCTMDDVIYMSQQPFVRAFLLDSVDIGCESELPDSECERSFIHEAGQNAPNCFAPIQSLNNFIYFDTLDKIESYRSADGKKSLKCSIFEELLKCYLSIMPRTASGTVCSPAQIAPAVTRSAHIMYYVTFNHDLGRGKPELKYNSCEADISSNMPAVPEAECPSRAAVADMVAAVCGYRMLTVLAAGSDNICETGKHALNLCLEEVNIPNAGKCGDVKDHLERSLMEYSDFLAGKMGGFDYKLCTGEKVPMGCTTEYIKQMMIDPVCGRTFAFLRKAEDDWEKCGIFEDFLGCVKFGLQYAGINCSIQEMEMKAQQSPAMAHLSFCKACYMPTWRVNGDPGSKPSEVFVTRQNKTTQESNNDVLITVKAYNFNEATDWVGIGISYNTRMDRSDIYTIQKKDNNWIVTDRYALIGSYSKPEPDTSRSGTSSATLRWAKMINGNLIAQFTRKVDTRDSDTDVVMFSDRYLLYARGLLGTDGDISKHSFKSASSLYLFTCLPYEHFEENIPKTLPDICTMPASTRINLRVYCHQYDIDLLHSEEDRCRAELGRRYCVYATLKPLGCTENQIYAHFTNPDVRLGLLDQVNPGCEASLPDSSCAKYYFHTSQLTTECWGPLIRFYEYVLKTTDSDSEVNAIPSVEGAKLKCKILDELVRCMLLKDSGFRTANNGDSQCTPASVAPAIQDALRMYYQVAKPTETVRTIPFSDCLADMTSLPYPTRACPSKQSAINLIATCAGEVMGKLGDGTDAACGAFNKCFKELAFEGEELCGPDYFDRALEETQYRNYLKARFGGVLDPATCRGCFPLREGLVGICVQECNTSADCSLGHVCCSNGCGHTCQPRYVGGADAEPDKKD